MDMIRLAAAILFAFSPGAAAMQSEAPTAGPAATDGESTLRDVVVRIVPPPDRPMWFHEPAASAISLVDSASTRHGATAIPNRAKEYLVADVPLGKHEVRVDSEEFEVTAVEAFDDGWQMSPAARSRPGGETVMVHVRGLAWFQLHARDAGTGMTIPRIDVEGHLYRRTPNPTGPGGRTERSGKRVLRSEFDSESGHHVFRHCMPGTHRLVVSADGYLPLEIDVPDVTVGQTPTIDVPLIGEGTITGSVVDASGQPVAHVAVGLYAPAGSADSRESRFLSEHDYQHYWPQPQERTTMRREVQVVTTDGSGTFRLRKVEPGTWIVRAYASRAVDAFTEPLAIGPGDHLEDLRLDLPEGRVLNGRLIGPPDAVFERTIIHAVAADDRERGEWLRAEVEPDGRFRIGPFLPGAVFVRVEFEDAPSEGWEVFGHFVGPPGRALGSVDLPARPDAVVDFDARGLFPGRLELSVSVNGVPTHFAASKVSAPGESAWIALSQPSVEDRRVAVEAVVPGAYHIVILGPQDRWTWMSPEAHTVGGNETTKTSIDIRTHGHTLQCVDRADGQPLRNMVVCLYQRVGDGWDPIFRRTDEAGRLFLDLPTSSLRLLAVGESAAALLPSETPQVVSFLGDLPLPDTPGDSMPSVEWRESGPEPATVSLVEPGDAAR